MKSHPANFRTNERRQSLKRTYLYRFNYEGTSYYLTNFDQDVTVNGGPVSKMSDPQVFSATQIAHSNPTESTDEQPGAVSVSLASTDAELRKYFLTVSPRVITVEIWRASSVNLPGPLEYDDDLYMVFSGLAQAMTFDEAVISVSCVSPLEREDMPVPRFYYQKQCNHMLYSQEPGECLVNPALFSISGITVNTIDRQSGWVEFNSLTTINVDSPARTVTITAETFQGGMIRDSLGNEIGVMLCQPLTGPTRLRLWLVWFPPTLAAGQTVDLFCGCLHIKRVCHDLFFNLPNFGGTPYVPKTNPAIDGVSG